jgi:hypothetical protein
MGNSSWLKVLTIVSGLVIAIMLLSQKSSTASPEPPQPDGRYQLHSGEVIWLVRPGVSERRPTLLRIDTQSGNTWYLDTVSIQWKPINNP